MKIWLSLLLAVPVAGLMAAGGCRFYARVGTSPVTEAELLRMAPREWLTIKEVPEAENMWNVLAESPLAGQKPEAEKETISLLRTPTWTKAQLKRAEEILASNKEWLALGEELGTKSGLGLPSPKSHNWTELDPKTDFLTLINMMCALEISAARVQGNTAKWASLSRKQLRIQQIIARDAPTALWHIRGARMMEGTFRLLLRAETPEQRALAGQIAKDFEVPSPVPATVQAAVREMAHILVDLNRSPRAGLAMNEELDRTMKSALEGHPKRIDAREAMRKGVEALRPYSRTKYVSTEDKPPLVTGLMSLRGPLPIWVQPGAEKVEPITPEMAQQLRKAFRSMDNPVGMVGASFSVGGILEPSMIDRLPRTLRAMILALEDGKPEPLPQDPFGRGPLKIDRERKLIWSVGTNGFDDGGKGNPLRPTRTDPDLVVRFP